MYTGREHKYFSDDFVCLCFFASRQINMSCFLLEFLRDLSSWFLESLKSTNDMIFVEIPSISFSLHQDVEIVLLLEHCLDVVQDSVPAAAGRRGRHRRRRVFRGDELDAVLQGLQRLLLMLL